MSFLDNLSPEDLLILNTAIAISLSKDRSVEELNVIGNFLVGIGSSLLITASQQQYISSKQAPNNSTDEDTVIG